MKAHPRVSVYCRCGAQWHGRYAVANPVIHSHRARCGRMLSERQYARRYAVRKPWKDAGGPA
jgi:hypothetical protein